MRQFWTLSENVLDGWNEEAESLSCTSTGLGDTIEASV